MKKQTILLAVVGLLALTGCYKASPAGLLNQSVIQIDGCEYFRYETSYGYGNITHKGNCKNPIHYQK